jgi:hypothetical protein
MFQSWFIFIAFFQLLSIAFAEIIITYPTSDVTYTALGPDSVGWTFSKYACCRFNVVMIVPLVAMRLISLSDDPSNITIYMVTYSADKVINNLYGLTWATASGSVEITLQYPPVPG